jgi:hypothetical protein
VTGGLEDAAINIAIPLLRVPQPTNPSSTPQRFRFLYLLANGT